MDGIPGGEQPRSGTYVTYCLGLSLPTRNFVLARSFGVFGTYVRRDGIALSGTTATLCACVAPFDDSLVRLSSLARSLNSAPLFLYFLMDWTKDEYLN